MTNTITHRLVRLLTVAAAATALLGALAVSQSQAALRHFDGTVLSKNRTTHTFRIKTQNGKRVRFHVNRRTEFERIRHRLRGLKRGLRVEVDAKRTDHGRLAKKVERDRR